MAADEFDTHGGPRGKRRRHLRSSKFEELYGFRRANALAEAATELDFVAKMDGGIRISSHGDGVRYRKRHFLWLSTDTKFANGARIIQIVNQRNDATLRFDAGAQGAFKSLSISRPQVGPEGSWSAAGNVAEQKNVIVKYGTLLGQKLDDDGHEDGAHTHRMAHG